MNVLVAYDVATDTREGRKRLRRVAQVCCNFGQRVQKSVFECSVDQMQYENMLRHLVRCIKEDEDSLRVYRLMEPKERAVKSFGLDRSIDFEKPLIV